jgi:hypothetical protein
MAAKLTGKIEDEPTDQTRKEGKEGAESEWEKLARKRRGHAICGSCGKEETGKERRRKN